MTTLTGFLDMMVRRDVEWARGRINRFPSIWVWADDRPDIVAILEDKEPKAMHSEDGTLYRLHESGRLSACKKGECVICPNNEMWPNNFASNGGRWVSYSACRKCVFYQKAGTYRYATCKWAHKERTRGKTPEAVAAENMVETFHEAAKLTKEIMGS